jgi:hypothetical protein
VPGGKSSLERVEKQQQHLQLLLEDMARATTDPEVDFEDHPLCEETEEDEDEPPTATERSAPSPAPERRSRNRSADLGAGEADDEGLPDRDEALSEGDSSYGDDPQFAGAP